MDIIIIAHFTGVFDDMDNGRFRYLAEHLSQEKHKVEIVTSSFDHDRKCQKSKNDSGKDYQITHIFEPK